MGNGFNINATFFVYFWDQTNIPQIVKFYISPRLCIRNRNHRRTMEKKKNLSNGFLYQCLQELLFCVMERGIFREIERGNKNHKLIQNVIQNHNKNEFIILIIIYYDMPPESCIWVSEPQPKIYLYGRFTLQRQKMHNSSAFQTRAININL